MPNRLFLLIALALALFSSSVRAETDKVYNKIIQSQTIECGYADWAPFLSIDANTHEVSGIMRDVWEAIGKKLGLKIVWKSFVGWGDITEAVRTNKIDVFCVGVWPDAGRTKNMLLSRPVFYNPAYLFARADDTRFDNNYESLNNPDHTVIGQEGDVTGSLLGIKFPKAKSAHIPPMAMQSDMWLSLVAKKGDVVLMDLPYAQQYMKENPGKIRQVKGAPVAIFPTAIPLAVGEYQLKGILDAVLNDMINDGTIAALIKKYGNYILHEPTPIVSIEGGL
jgi:ABC-type amino acid transport substrate-binding protein